MSVCETTAMHQELYLQVIVPIQREYIAMQTNSTDKISRIRVVCVVGSQPSRHAAVGQGCCAACEG